MLTGKGGRRMMGRLGKLRERKWLGQRRKMSCEGRGREVWGGEMFVAKAGEKVKGR